MSVEKIKQKLFAQAVKDSKWLEEATWRAENEAWLDISFAIAIVVGKYLKERNLSQKYLAAQLGYSPQYVSKILKGSENLTLETITKLEKVMGIKLIEVPELKWIENQYHTELPLALAGEPTTPAYSQRPEESNENEAPPRKEELH